MRHRPRKWAIQCFREGLDRPVKPGDDAEDEATTVRERKS
jgi:hypothetical protein